MKKALRETQTLRALAGASNQRPQNSTTAADPTEFLQLPASRIRIITEVEKFCCIPRKFHKKLWTTSRVISNDRDCYSRSPSVNRLNGRLKIDVDIIYVELKLRLLPVSNCALVILMYTVFQKSHSFYFLNDSTTHQPILLRFGI